MQKLFNFNLNKFLFFVTLIFVYILSTRMWDSIIYAALATRVYLKINEFNRRVI